MWVNFKNASFEYLFINDILMMPIKLEGMYPQKFKIRITTYKLQGRRMQFQIEGAQKVQTANRK